MVPLRRMASLILMVVQIEPYQVSFFRSRLVSVSMTRRKSQNRTYLKASLKIVNSKIWLMKLKNKLFSVPGLNEDQLVDEQRLFPPMPEAPGVTNGVKDWNDKKSLERLSDDIWESKCHNPPPVNHMEWLYTSVMRRVFRFSYLLLCPAYLCYYVCGETPR